MRRTPIRMKLAAALAVPLVGLLLITVVEIVDTSNDVDRVRSQTELARASIGPSGLITSLQNERTWAVVELIGQETAITPPVVGYAESRAATDQAISSFRETLKGEGAAATVYEPALANLDELAELRDGIDASTTPRELSNIPFSDEVYAGYARMIRPFLDANTRVALAVDDAQLRHVTSLVDITTRQVETLSDLARASILEIVLGGGLDEPGEIATTAKIKSVFDDANDELRAASPPYDDIMATTFPDELATSFTEQLDAAMAGGEVDLETIMGTLDVPADGGYMGLRNALVAALNDRADELNRQAEARERVYIALAVATLAIAITLTWLVSRSITKPLRSLTRQAKEMADHRLPNAVNDILDTPLGENIAVPRVDPVRVRTRDEVADVADALNTVQDTAIDLAVEQAVLRRNIADSFVNLGRRNQNLLGRQLDFITELESNETDAEALSNLFRLDHLATRMRRNAESLLVLAGFEPPRQWAAPVRLTDVIRAALGEVESYQRVTVRGAEPATVIGSAAADLAHLLAELIENALVFSPPDQTVEIRGRNRNDGGYTLAIIDSGLGMSAGDLAAANRRLAGAESFTIAPSKYLGHYVAGNLAARHRIAVRLDNSPGSGITATITVPPSLLTDERVTSAPVTPPHGHRLPPAPAPAAQLLPASVGPSDDRVVPDGPRHMAGTPRPGQFPGPPTALPPGHAPPVAPAAAHVAPPGASPPPGAAAPPSL
ncbi:MAG TPA: ATP-binding protein, partial [Acidimicrobiales bacterium]